MTGRITIIAGVIALGACGPATSSGSPAEPTHNKSAAAETDARALAAMLPLKISMRDHLRQEKTGKLPSPLPEGERQRDFSAGTIGLWGDRDFVIYYRDGRVPSPGIVVLGQVRGDVSLFDDPGPVTISLQASLSS